MAITKEIKVRKIIEIDEDLCNGCGECVPDCAEGSLVIENGKAKLIEDKLCDGLGACLGSCPTGALKIVERMAEDFDEEAVEAHLEAERKKAEQSHECGCSGHSLQSLSSLSTPSPQQSSPAGSSSCQSANSAATFQPSSQSALSHWPIQIRLVKPDAPFLQNADLLIVADCCSVAARDFQQRYLDQKKVMLGCPKFDDSESYIDKFTQIINGCSLKSITLLIMEVPCCSSMNVIVKKALERAEKSVSVEQITLSLQGEEISRKTW